MPSLPLIGYRISISEVKVKLGDTSFLCFHIYIVSYIPDASRATQPEIWWTNFNV